MSSYNKIDLYREFVAGVYHYQNLYTEDTVSHVCIFDPAL